MDEDRKSRVILEEYGVPNVRILLSSCYKTLSAIDIDYYQCRFSFYFVGFRIYELSNTARLEFRKF